MAGDGDGEDGRLDGLAAAQAVVTGDLEETKVALAAVEVPFKGGGHGDDAGGLEDVGFFGKRIGEARRLHVGWTEERVTIFGNVRNGENFAIAEPDEALPSAPFPFVFRHAPVALS